MARCPLWRSLLFVTHVFGLIAARILPSAIINALIKCYRHDGSARGIARTGAFRLDIGTDSGMQDARERIPMSDDDIVSHFSRFGYRVSIGQIAFTGETVQDFREARLGKWWKAGKLRLDEPGLLRIEDAQPRPDQRTRDVIVVSFGGARAVMGVEIKPGAPPLRSGDATNRYAPTMEWAHPGKAAKAAAAGKPAKVG